MRGGENLRRAKLGGASQGGVGQNCHPQKRGVLYEERERERERERKE